MNEFLPVPIREIRINPLTIPAQAIAGLKGLLMPMVFAYFGLSRRDEDDPFGLSLWIGFGGLFVLALYQTVVYLTTKIHVDERSIDLKAGFIWTVHQVVPIERVQEIQMKSNLVQRAFGLVELECETAAGGDKLKIVCLKKADAEAFRDSVIGQRHRQATPEMSVAAAAENVPPVLQETPILSLPFQDILLAGALGNRAFYLLFLGIGLMWEQRLARSYFDGFNPNKVWDSKNMLLIAGFFTALFALGWVVSIVMTLNKYYGFTLVRTDRGLRIRHGLTNQVEKSVRQDRIQFLQLKQPILFRKAGLFKVEVKAANNSRDSEDKDQDKSMTLTPGSRLPTVLELARLAFPTLDLASFPWRSIPRSAFLRRVVSMSVTIPFLFIPFFILKHPGWLYGAIAWIALSTLAIWLRVRNTRFGLSQEFFGEGIVSMAPRREFSPVARLQSIDIDESPFGRRLGLVDVKASFPMIEISISDMSREDSVEVVHRMLAERRKNPTRGV